VVVRRPEPLTLIGVALMGKDTMITDEYGDQYWYLDGKRHKEDGPVIIRSDGTQVWCINNQIYREHSPAMICANGYQVWFTHGELGRSGVRTA